MTTRVWVAAALRRRPSPASRRRPSPSMRSRITRGTASAVVALALAPRRRQSISRQQWRPRRKGPQVRRGARGGPRPGRSGEGGRGRGRRRGPRPRLPLRLPRRRGRRPDGDGVLRRRPPVRPGPHRPRAPGGAAGGGERGLVVVRGGGRVSRGGVGGEDAGGDVSRGERRRGDGGSRRRRRGRRGRHGRRRDVRQQPAHNADDSIDTQDLLDSYCEDEHEAQESLVAGTSGSSDAEDAPAGRRQGPVAAESDSTFADDVAGEAVVGRRLVRPTGAEGEGARAALGREPPADDAPAVAAVAAEESGGPPQPPRPSATREVPPPSERSPADSEAADAPAAAEARRWCEDLVATSVAAVTSHPASENVRSLATRLHVDAGAPVHSSTVDGTAGCQPEMRKSSSLGSGNLLLEETQPASGVRKQPPSITTTRPSQHRCFADRDCVCLTALPTYRYAPPTLRAQCYARWQEDRQKVLHFPDWRHWAARLSCGSPWCRGSFNK